MTHTTTWTAWPEGADPRVLAEALRDAHEAFLTTGEAGGAVRPVVLDSWRRCVRGGVDPEHATPEVALDRSDLLEFRAEHPVAAAFDLVRRLLLDSPVVDGMVVAVGDAAGRLLWVDGDRTSRGALEEIGFTEGAVWSEDVAGTNAPGLALARDHELQVYGAEHFAHAVQPWSCTASPIHDLRTGRVIGVLDVTGHDDAASPVMLALVRATAAAVESHLLSAAAPGPTGVARSPAAETPGPVRPAGTERLTVLGARTGSLVGPWSSRSLSLRHTEILVLLAEHGPLSASELAVLLRPDDGATVTVRVEVSRLRRVVGRLLADGSPYALARHLRTDVDDVRGLLDTGDVLGAVHRYAGPVLPASEAPGVARVRSAVDADLRSAVLASDDPRVSRAWVSAAHGAEDWDVLGHLVTLLPARSIERRRVETRLDSLDRALA